MGDAKFKDHNLMGVNPLNQQFEPTDAQPIRQHARMAGDPASGSSRMTPLRKPRMNRGAGKSPVRRRAPFRG